MVRLWPKGPVLSVQYAVSRLRDEASHEKFDWHEVKEQCDLLEANGIQAYIEENGTPFYLTSGADAAQIQKAAREKMGSRRQALVWDDDGFACVYTSSRRQAAIYAAGDMPYQQPPYTAEQKSLAPGGEGVAVAVVWRRHAAVPAAGRLSCTQPFASGAGAALCNAAQCGGYHTWRLYGSSR